MAAPGIPLTVAGGGMTRLRTKGAALKNSLYQLTNGYVTMAQTVKVRPGTFRQANLADYTIGGISKGVVAFQGSRHIFSHQAGTVPPGYTLHVLNHPAATTTDPASQTLYFMTPAQFANPTSLGFNNLAGDVHGLRGYSGKVILAPEPASNVGSITSSSSGDRVGGSIIEAIAYTVPTSSDDPNTLYVVLGSDYDYSSPRSFTYPKQGGGTNTVSIQASAVTSILDLGSGFTAFGWSVGSDLPDFSGSSVVVQFGGGNDIVPIPLKDIHFAAPFMGFLYVVAEFDVDSTTLAAWGSTYHYWLQTSGTWAPDTVYTIGQFVTPTVPNGFSYRASRISAPNPAWTPQTLHAVDDIVEPTVANGYYFTAIETDGANPLTGLVEPTWPTTTGATVAEDSETASNDVVAAAPASQTQPAPATGTKYINPYQGI